MPFATFERNIRDQLGRTLPGFDPARDIEGITVNRWAHGYAYGYNSLFDPDWSEEEKPWVLGRKPFGHIAIANSDAGAIAYTDCAIDQAYRAVSELMKS
jgi:spermidine dehydrogenase